MELPEHEANSVARAEHVVGEIHKLGSKLDEKPKGERMNDSDVNIIKEHVFGGSGGVLLLSGTTTTAGASVGTVIGNFSVSGGSTRAYTFSLTSNPGGLFSVGGSTLAVAAALTAGTDPITARASDTGVSVINGSFNITVTSTSAGTAALQFNIASNSMYIPLLGGIG